MKQAADPVQDVGEHRAGGFASGPAGAQAVLDRFEVPVGEVAAEEVAQHLGDALHAEGLELLVHAADRALLPGQDPPVLELQAGPHLRQRPDGFVAEGHEGEAAGVPQLVDEVAPGREGRLEVLVIEADVGADARAGEYGEAERVRAEEVHHLEGIDAVAQRLRHLAAPDVAHGAVQVDAREGGVGPWRGIPP